MRMASLLLFSAAFAGAQIPGPVAGEVVISELMPNPASILDEVGEYFEVTNIGTHAVELQGCSFADITVSTVVSVTIGTSLVLAPGQACAFVRDAATAAAIVPTGLYYSYVGCGAPACTTTGNLLLGNSATGDGIIFRDSAGQVLDVAGYGALTTSAYAAQAAAAALPAPSSAYNGSAYEIKDLRAGWFTPGNVAPSTALVPGITDHGTPGWVNSVDTTLAFLRTTAAPAVGTVVPIQILGPRHAASARVLGASFGNTGFPLGPLVISIDLDALFWMSLDPANGVFGAYGLGSFSLYGESSASMSLPPLPLLAGLTVYHHAVILDSTGAPIAVTEPLATTLL